MPKPKPRFYMVTCCEECLMARNPSLLYKPEQWSTSEFPYCVLIVQAGDYSRAKLTCGPGGFHEKCTLLSRAEVVNMGGE